MKSPSLSFGIENTYVKMLAEVGVEPLPTDEGTKQKCSVIDHSANLVICVYNTYTLCRHMWFLFLWVCKMENRVLCKEI